MSQKGSFPIERKNAPTMWWADFYFRLVRLPWHHLILGAFGFYIAVNFVFGAAYFFFRDGLRPQNLSFADCFFFSVHTFSTVGYGNMAPASVPVHLLTVVETFAGLIFMALLTGLFFSKFAQPTARFLFSNKILATKHYAKDALIFRVANIRSNRVMDADVTLTVLFDEITPEGIYYRRLEELPLERSHTPIFSLSLTCVHFLNDQSRSMLERIKRKENVEFLASVRGLDDTFGQTIHASILYRPEDVHWGCQFADILTIKPDGTRIIDFARFNDLK